VIGGKYMIDERMWQIMQKRLGYSDEEIALFRTDPKNEQVLEKAKELSRINLIAEVIEAHGCNSRHKKGDRFRLDGYGNLIKEPNPDKICIFALGALVPGVFAAQELVYAGVDPNKMRFRSVGCIDVGIRCGGWGKVIMHLSAEEVNKNQINA
jgi:uncharacterized repeat protein (TIGR04076 family)